MPAEGLTGPEDLKLSYISHTYMTRRPIVYTIYLKLSDTKLLSFSRMENGWKGTIFGHHLLPFSCHTAPGWSCHQHPLWHLLRDEGDWPGGFSQAVPVAPRFQG